MSIRRGAPWGEDGDRGGLPDDAVVVAGNRELRQLVEEHRRDARPLPPVGLAGGDLWRTLGGTATAKRLDGNDAQLLTVDIGAVLVDGRLHWFVAHLVARRTWWSGRVWVAANAAHHGRWNIAPRAHPGDGLLDVLDGDLAIGQRFEARRRLPRGDHVPHHDIAYRRVAAMQVTFDRATPVWLDGDRIGIGRHLSLRLEPDALRVVI